MATRVEELYEKKRSVYADMQQMMAVDQGEWTPEDEVRWNEIDGDFKAVEVEIEKEEASQARRARFAAIENQKEETKWTDRTERGEMQALREGRLPGKTTGEVRQMAFSAWLRPSTATRDQIFASKQADIPYQQPEIVLRAFQPTMGETGYQAADSRDMGAAMRRCVEKRAQSAGTGSEGGYTVPEGMMMPLEIALLQFGAPRRYADVVRAGDGRSVPWPTVNDTSNKGEIVAENAAASQQDVTFGQVTTTPYLYSSKYVPVSIQLMQDSNESMGALLGRLLGERIGRIQSDHFTTGTGSSQPSGLLTGATDSSVALNADNAPNLANLIALKHSVDPAYRQQGHGWAMSDLVLSNIKKITADGQPLWQAGLASGEPNTIDGDPYFINQSMPTGTGTGVKSIAYGQLNKYKIHDALDITFRRLDELHALNHQVTFLAFMRSDGVLLDAGTAPVKYATNP